MLDRFPTRRRGFTLIEMVIVIAVTGIVAGMVAIFIRRPVQAYVDSEVRAELTGAAENALQRMVRELRLAVPNSVRITTDADGKRYIEFLLTKTGGRYLAAQDALGGGNILDFTDASKLSFDVVGTMPSGQEAIIQGDFIVVNNLVTATADAYSCASASAGCNIASVSAVNGNTVTLDSNPFATQSPVPAPSPGRRFQVVTSPVTYVCDSSASAGTVHRYSDYAITANQPNDTTAAPLSGAGSRALMVDGVTACSFSFVAGSLEGTPRADLIGLSLQLTKHGETVRIFRQVHVDNQP